MAQSSVSSKRIAAKQLGQVFSGMSVARLLAKLAAPANRAAVMDPMCGSGDMLAACAGEQRTLFGIEIDDHAYNMATARLRAVDNAGLQLICGDAFRPETITALQRTEFDLVITNPPYIRYQTLANGGDGPLASLNAAEVRANLAETIERTRHLDSCDKRLFGQIARAYSGHSDLAVPSWILSALLVKQGGVLAMVLPESWLSRNYAAVIQYLLLRCFKVRYVVRDGTGTWFPGVLVRTHLLIADRIRTKQSHLEWSDQRYLDATVNVSATPDSLIGRIYPDSRDPEVEFLADLQASGQQLSSGDTLPIKVTHSELHHLAARFRVNVPVGLNLAASAAPRGPIVQSGSEAFVPGELDRLDIERTGDWLTMADLGWKVGQGLRTGCNAFFYVELVDARNEVSIVRVPPVFGLGLLHVPAGSLTPVLRRQAEVSESDSQDPHGLRGRVLCLQEYALAEDIGRCQDYKPAPPDLARYIRTAALTTIGTRGPIPTMSAVRTNVRHTAGRQRFWYHLPEFTLRHVGQLFIPRINHGSPIAAWNPHGVVIDANFSTLWSDEEHGADSMCLLALLRSTWCRAMMELSGSVLGGGALKLEATHLRGLALPRMDSEQRQTLSRLGEAAVQGKSVGRKIDEVVGAALWPRPGPARMEALEQLLAGRVRSRRQQA